MIEREFLAAIFEVYRTLRKYNSCIGVFLISAQLYRDPIRDFESSRGTAFYFDGLFYYQFAYFYNILWQNDFSELFGLINYLNDYVYYSSLLFGGHICARYHMNVSLHFSQLLRLSNRWDLEFQLSCSLYSAPH